MLSRQLGKINISLNMIHTKPEMAAQIFAAMEAVVVRAESIYASGTLEYTLISHMFKEVPIGIIPAYYSIKADVQDNKLVYIQVEQSIFSSLLMNHIPSEEDKSEED